MNIVSFVKNWTLPIAMGLGAAFYLIFLLVPFLDEAGDTLAPYFDILLPAFMFLVLFVTFCKVDFHKMRPVWWHLWTTLLNLLFVGVITGFIIGFRMKGDALVLMESLLMCIIAPCATAAAVVTQKLGGSLEEITTYTFESNFICAVIVPFCFPMIEQRADVSFWVAFSHILYQVVVVLLVPMLLAYIVKHWLKRLHRRIVSTRDLSFYLWACSLMIVTGITVRNIVHAQTTVMLLVAIAVLGLVACIIQFAVGRYIGRHCGRELEAGQALGQKNTSFAIWLSYTFLNPLSSVGPGCYILWQNIINSIEIWQKRKHDELGAAKNNQPKV